MSTGRIHLIPNLISDSPTEKSLPSSIHSLVVNIEHYMVENVRNARRYLKKLDRQIDIDALTFYSMGKHAEDRSEDQALHAVMQGYDLGVISDAGCPGVADPGGSFIQRAHSKGIKIIPHVGPSSILLTLMASGLNGQNFCFHGYLAKDNKERQGQFKNMTRSIRKEKRTHLFMDTPFRNQKLYEELLEQLPKDLLLCVARDITGEKEWIRTKSINDWLNEKPELNKIPVIFALGH
jgi:16S rRNA (cytidine1402-2'-O)-methyltransferase